MNRNTDEKDRIPFQSIKITLFILAILGLFSFSVLSLLKGMDTVTSHQFFYSENSNLDYSICLKKNDYFTEKCLDKNKHYIASLIDYIDIEYKYNFNASSLFDYTYSYYITASVVANEKGEPDKILYNEEEVILEKQDVSKNNSNSFVVHEHLRIDYSKYNNLMTTFKKHYTLVFESRLIITFHIELHGDYDNIDEEIETNQQIELTIPLSEQTLSIEASYTDINDSEVIKNETAISNTSILYYVLGGIYFLLGLFILYKLLELIWKINKAESQYEKKLKKILKEYDQIIVETNKIPYFDETKIIEVRSFEELLDAKETVRRPILHIKQEHQSIFIILSNNEAFRYILKEISPL